MVAVLLVGGKFKIMLPAPSSSQASLMRPGGLALARPTLTETVVAVGLPAAFAGVAWARPTLPETVVAVVLPAAFAGLPMMRICSGSVPIALGPVHVAVCGK